jgi:ADP-ribose pyrophosphatase YjhB (NUDIX family)
MKFPPPFLAAVAIEIKAVGLIKRTHTPHRIVGGFVRWASPVWGMLISHVVPKVYLVLLQELRER